MHCSVSYTFYVFCTARLYLWWLRLCYYCAVLCIAQTMPSKMVSLSIYLSVTCQYYVKMAEHHQILHHQVAIGIPLMGMPEAQRYEKSQFWPVPHFKLMPFFDAEYFRNGMRYRHSCIGILIRTYRCLFKSVISNDFECLGEIFNDAMHRVVSACLFEQIQYIPDQIA